MNQDKNQNLCDIKYPQIIMWDEPESTLEAVYCPPFDLIDQCKDDDDFMFLSKFDDLWATKHNEIRYNKKSRQMIRLSPNACVLVTKYAHHDERIHIYYGDLINDSLEAFEQYIKDIVDGDDEIFKYCVFEIESESQPDPDVFMYENNPPSKAEIDKMSIEGRTHQYHKQINGIDVWFLSRREYTDRELDYLYTKGSEIGMLMEEDI